MPHTQPVFAPRSTPRTSNESPHDTEHKDPEDNQEQSIKQGYEEIDQDAILDDQREQLANLTNEETQETLAYRAFQQAGQRESNEAASPLFESDKKQEEEKHKRE